MNGMFSMCESSSLLIRRKRKCSKRREWVHHILLKREEFGEFHHLMKDLKQDPKKFFDYFRMNLDTFTYILEHVRFELTKDSNFRRVISAEERLAVTLRYLATGSSFKTIGYSFRIANNTVGGIVHETCRVIWEKLVKVHMKFPSNEEAIDIAERFWRRWKFPNCIGAIDGKHIRIKAPSHSGSLHYNYKQFFSIVLQAVVGSDYRFIAIEVGAYGKESDGGIFSNSNLSSMLQNGSLNVDFERQLPDTEVFLPHVMIGDEAYPLKKFLMRPYPQKKAECEEQNFNERLSLARQVVECAFGIMTSKWRILTRPIEVEPHRTDNIIKCICLLHNIILDREGAPIQFNYQSNGAEPTTKKNRASTSGENHATWKAFDIREKFKHFFTNNPL